jgi:hypothetical protein
VPVIAHVPESTVCEVAQCDARNRTQCSARTLALIVL